MEPKNKQKIAIGSRVDERTRWILQELANCKHTTLSVIVDNVLTQYANGYLKPCMEEEDEKFILMHDIDAIFLKEARERYDALVAASSSNINQIKRQIKGINLSTLRTMVKDVDCVIETMKYFDYFELVPKEDLRECINLINDKCRRMAHGNIVKMSDLKKDKD